MNRCQFRRHKLYIIRAAAWFTPVLPAPHSYTQKRCSKMQARHRRLLTISIYRRLYNNLCFPFYSRAYTTIVITPRRPRFRRVFIIICFCSRPEGCQFFVSAYCRIVRRPLHPSTSYRKKNGFSTRLSHFCLATCQRTETNKKIYW